MSEPGAVFNNRSSLSGISAFGMRQGWSILVYIGTLWAPSSFGPHSLPLFHIQGHRTQGQIHWGWCVKRSAPLRHAQLLHWHQWKCFAGWLHNTLNLGLIFKHFVWKVLQHTCRFVCHQCIFAMKLVGELMIMGADVKPHVIFVIYPRVISRNTQYSQVGLVISNHICCLFYLTSFWFSFNIWSFILNHLAFTVFPNSLIFKNCDQTILSGICIMH